MKSKLIKKFNTPAGPLEYTGGMLPEVSVQAPVTHINDSTSGLYSFESDLKDKEGKSRVFSGSHNNQPIYYLKSKNSNKIVGYSYNHPDENGKFSWDGYSQFLDNWNPSTTEQNQEQFDRTHTERNTEIKRLNHNNPMYKGLTLNGNTDLSYAGTKKNNENQEKLGQDLQNTLHEVAKGAVGLGSSKILNTIDVIDASNNLIRGNYKKAVINGLNTALSNVFKNGGQMVKKFQTPSGPIGWRMPWYDSNSGWVSNKVVSTEENPILYNEKEDKEQNFKQKLKDLTKEVLIKFNNWEDLLYLKYDRIIPYLEDKDIVLTHPDKNKKFKDRGAAFSTNMLDSIAKYANAANLPLKSALGLVGQESTFGKGRYGKQMDNPAEYLISNWAWSDQNPYNELLKIAQNKSYLPHIDSNGNEYWERDEKMYYEILSKGLRYADNQAKIRLENLQHPLQHGFELYKSGKYNLGDPRHTQMVEERGDMLMESPEIQKWMSESPYVNN